MGITSNISASSIPSCDAANTLVADWQALAHHSSRFLAQLREFDLQRDYARLRKGGRSASSCVDWLNGNLGIGNDAGREALRVAYALLNLPGVEDAFEAGELSYRKVRALAGTVTAADEASVLDFARAMTDAQVEDYCRAIGSRRPCAGGSTLQAGTPKAIGGALAAA